MIEALKVNSGKLLLAVFAGVLLTAAFPVIDAWYAAWAAVALLLFAVREPRPRLNFWLGFLAGLVHYLSLLYWLVPTMRIYGYLPWVASLLSLILLAGYLALYIALFAWLLTRLCPRPAMILGAAPLFWVGLEYLRGALFSGFPWGLLGYSQYRQLSLVQISDIFGVWGVSALVVLANGVVFLLIAYFAQKSWQKAAIRRRTAGAGVLLLLLVLFSVWGYGSFRRGAVDRRLADAETLDVAVVQGNVAQMLKWDKAFREKTLDKYFSLSAKAAASQPEPELLVWPETAAPFYFNYETEFREKLLDGIADHGRAYLVGAPSVDISGENPVYYNSAYLIDAGGQVAGRYDKVHLVPFGEYVPLKNLLPFMDTLVAQVGNFDAGEKGHTISGADVDIGMLICYEAIFPGLSAEMAANGADFLVNITNDAWFGKTAAPAQHFSMAVFRAVENRRSLVRAANTGISGFIDPAGRVLETSALLEPAVLNRRVALLQGDKTIYTRYKDFLPYGCLIASLIGIVIKLIIYKFLARE